jgi:hypothetical protein
MEASEQNDGTPSPDLTPDAASQAAIDTTDAVALKGFLGEGCTPQYVRLYESVALNHWLEIPSAVIVDRVPAPVGDGQSTVWVQRDADLAKCESVRASNFESPSGPEEPRVWPRP